jgi:hypothetical protein
MGKRLPALEICAADRAVLESRIAKRKGAADEVFRHSDRAAPWDQETHGVALAPPVCQGWIIGAQRLAAQLERR